MPYDELSPERGRGEGAVLAARRGVQEAPERCPAGAGAAPALQGDRAVARGQARVAARAGAGAERGQRHGLLVALGVAGVLDPGAGERLLRTAKSSCSSCGASWPRVRTPSTSPQPSTGTPNSSARNDPPALQSWPCWLSQHEPSTNSHSALSHSLKDPACLCPGQKDHLWGHVKPSPALERLKLKPAKTSKTSSSSGSSSNSIQGHHMGLSWPYSKGKPFWLTKAALLVRCSSIKMLFTSDLPKNGLGKVFSSHFPGCEVTE